MGGSAKDVQSKKELDSVVHSGAPVVLQFWASSCEASKHMDEVFAHLSTDFPHAHFLRVEAEEQPEIFGAYSVRDVPYFAFVKDGKVADTLEGADPSILAHKVARVAGSVKPGEPDAPAPASLETVHELAKENGSSQKQEQIQAQNGLDDALKRRLQQLIDSNPLMLFMKGSPEEPKCNVSRLAIDILKQTKVKFGSFDVLTDNEVMEGIKRYSNWPIIPQIYYKGKPRGWSETEILMRRSGELEEVPRDHGIDTADSTGAKVIELEEVSKEHGMDTTDYAGAKVTEAGSGKSGISASTGSSHQQMQVQVQNFGQKRIQVQNGLDDALERRLQQLIDSNPIMLFMKGTPEEPKCKLSKLAIDMLKEKKIKFASFDVLTDNEVMEGIQKYSNWPTLPQLYIEGKARGLRHIRTLECGFRE
ncbi:unnamed protein product [Prunus armeniaca]|uniref:Thioredoxin domain-containing protein n=1 Tax=Prunus armeniaca TaxID=36596 RepID=A0A6J5WXD5_PRUAR|nr:unnamed protein product [Prunus armeniaca]CAB4306416.1 unnamed protein product [Prunus armeniaca]